MSGFSPAWLDLREPLDHAARSEIVLSAVAHYFLHQEKLQLIDLASGTGSTIRGVKPHLGQSLEWRLTDNDGALLKHAADRLEGECVTFAKTDLASNPDLFSSQQPDLVTTSAFLDLVSESWLHRFISQITPLEIPFYAALTYDGRTTYGPKHDLDDIVLSAVNAHQKTDKGFGPALGPDAARTAIIALRECGYLISEEKSDWRSGAVHGEFQSEFVKGCYNTACEILPDLTPALEQWLAFRLDQIAKGASEIVVGHIDFFAVPQ